MRKLLISTLFGLLLLPFNQAIAQYPATQDSVDVAYRWTAPTTGSPAVEYLAQLAEGGGEWVFYATTSDTNLVFRLEFDKTYQVRVAAYDAEGRMGPFSLPSDPYEPDRGTPSAPGKPFIITVY